MAVGARATRASARAPAASRRQTRPLRRLPRHGVAGRAAQRPAPAVPAPPPDADAAADHGRAGEALGPGRQRGDGSSSARRSSPLTAVAAGPIPSVGGRDRSSRAAVILTGKAPGTTVVTITDARGLTRDVRRARRVLRRQRSPTAIDARAHRRSRFGGLRARARSSRAVRRAAQRATRRADRRRAPTTCRSTATLAQDRVAVVRRSGADSRHATTSKSTARRASTCSNVAVPRISPDSLMVSDYPERLEENGTLFTADLRSEQPSRFLYFHYNPPGQPDRRIVLRAENLSPEPAIVQFISGRGGPSPNEMEVGHVATQAVPGQRRAESRAA